MQMQRLRSAVLHVHLSAMVWCGAEAVPDQIFLAGDANNNLLLCLVSRHTMQLQALRLTLQTDGHETPQASVSFDPLFPPNAGNDAQMSVKIFIALALNVK